MRELRDPETGHTALVVGTAHVSGPAAREVERLLQETPVEFCAVELDKDRLKSLMKRLHDLENGRSTRPDLPDTPWKALKVMYGAGPGRLFYIFSDSFSSSLLGVPYGVDMLAALATANKLGIPVVPIDRSSRVTIARCMNQSQHFVKMRQRLEQQQEQLAGSLDPQELQELSKKSPQERRKAVMRRMRETVRSVAEVVGCPDPDGAVGALVNMVHTAMDNKEVDPSDLQVVRECGSRVVEFMRNLAESGASEGEADRLSAAGAPSANKDVLRRMMGMMVDGEGPPALTKERDLILAQNLRLCTQKGSTLAVVGAAHVPGITRRWPEALSPQAQEEAKKYYMIPGKPHSRTATVTSNADDVSSAPALEGYQAPTVDGKDTMDWYAPVSPVKPMWTVPVGPLVAGAGLGVLSYYRPRAAALFGATFLGLAATGNYMVASTIANVGRAAGRLEDASKKLGLGGEGDNGFF